MSEETEPSEGIFGSVDLVKMAVVYMLNDFFDLEKLKVKAKHLEKTNQALWSQNEMIQEFLDGTKRCRIYGTCEQLTDELISFQNFPTSHKYFPLKFTTPYYTTPVLYKGLKGADRYVCNQDFHTILQYLVHDTVPAAKNHVISSLISIFLKSHEDVTIGKMDFRKFEISDFEAILADLKTTNYTYFDDSGALKSTFFKEEILEKLREDFAKIEDSEISGKFLKLIPTTTWSVEETEWIQKALENEKDQFSENHHPEHLICIYTNASLILKKLRKILEKWGAGAEPKDQKTTVIRIFEDGKNRFLLKSELFEALKLPPKIENFRDFDNSKLIKDPMKIRKIIKPKSKTKNLMSPPPSTDFAHGIPYSEGAKKFGAEFENLNFVRFPVKRTTHRAVPLLGPPSEKCGHSSYCIPAVDGLLEILKALIWGARIFQAFEAGRKKTIYEIFTDLALVFDAQQTTPTLIRCHRIRELTNAFTKKCEFHQKLEIPEIRDISEDDVLTLEDLKIELKNLKLLDFFPKIEELAEQVFQEIAAKNHEKSPKIWFDAVENCQLLCIMDTFPKLKSFLHAQKSCHRIAGLNCSSCEEFWKNSEDVTSSEFSGPPTEKFPMIGKCRIEPKIYEKVVGFPSDLKEAPEEEDEDSEAEYDVNEDSEDVVYSEKIRKLEILLSEDPEGVFRKIRDDVESMKTNFSKVYGDQDGPEIRKFKEALKKLEDVNAQASESYFHHRSHQNSKNVEIQTDSSLLEDSVLPEELAELRAMCAEISKNIDEWNKKQKEYDAVIRKAAQAAKKSDSRIKQLERDLNREQEKIVKQKKRILEASDLTRENLKLKNRISEMEEAELRGKEQQKNEIAFYTQKLADRDSKIEHLEKELKKSHDRNDALKNIFTTNSHLNEENEKLKMKISGCEGRETRMIESYEKMKKTFQEDRVKFSERIAEMARNLRSEKIKTSDVEQTAAQLRRQLKNVEDSDSIVEINQLKEDILEKRRYIQLILKKNTELEAEVTKNSRKFQKISEILGPQGAEPNRHGGGKSGRSLNLRAQEVFYEPTPLPKCLPIGAERSSSSSRRLLNSTSIAITPSTSSTTSAATPSSSSDGPSTVFLFSPPPGLTLGMKKTSMTSSRILNSELADSECVICLTEVNPTDKIIKCHECRRRFHGKCASDWLKVKSICPTCKGKLLDPDEFPAL